MTFKLCPSFSHHLPAISFTCPFLNSSSNSISSSVPQLEMCVCARMCVLVCMLHRRSGMSTAKKERERERDGSLTVPAIQQVEVDWSISSLFFYLRLTCSHKRSHMFFLDRLLPRHNVCVTKTVRRLLPL
ncbi:hypothetical protein AMELA_G00025010 [Ameiurus melas]|uniref:Uncharacterized protein n=1 Tax=Ameiurus melas TaxID=219545 RepID=A0A7J6BCK2_AMEME|nr:hypothetical protein AMELA_G00025010 [Ameiurus melas]